ncbi:hypothetical protein [Leifsonia sp. NPDC058230]|uniref:hypothetical protein n=1 Tax=Leifsonia sp. NPDC058230 TaxID=3346391 RepID=UPI0036D8FB7B
MSTNGDNPTTETGAGARKAAGKPAGKATGTPESTTEIVPEPTTETTPGASGPTEQLESIATPAADEATGETSPTSPDPSAPAAPVPPTPSPAWTYASTPIATEAVAVGRPHVRWGGVVWGAILVAIAGFVLYTVSSPDRKLAFESWVEALTPGAAWTLAVVAVGVFILILALLAVVRSAQRNRRA